jgi:hypothetical protein
MAEATRPAEADGLWQLAATLPIDSPPGRESNDIGIFLCEEGSVTLRLFAPHAQDPQSADGFYKLAARWEGSTLTYRPPFGAWARLADYDAEEGFLDIGSGVKRIFRRIAPQEVHQWDRAILHPRDPYRYGPAADQRSGL